ncbi:cysteine hydrolase family protein [Desulfosoma caldarium]|uniref:Nicotinamidase-related amidase n=1 Tax=Desulfosoma caldarium TaxID=610254 RepID=A0A3N1VL74_9BACT|nr:isochorismatase family cysteine hydrolase [Desulfosoma caldarium]ROR03546.1 nicotinamidase-related amidase [Desulfosoma caldarium]
MARKALLVIDMLNDFLDPRGALYCGETARAIIPTVGQLMEDFAKNGDMVVMVQDAHAQDDPEFKMFAPHAVRGTWGGAVIPELPQISGAIKIEKTRYSAFFGTDLDRILKEYAPEEVWVVGVCTSICVMDTVGDLRNRDYAVVVPSQAVADFDPEFHAFALKRMERVYGAVVR